MDSRTNKKRCAGRLRKQLADLTLQAGLPVEAIVQYSHAADTLRHCNDWLWLAGWPYCIDSSSGLRIMYFIELCFLTFLFN